jgi:hypothetical protein
MQNVKCRDCGHLATRSKDLKEVLEVRRGLRDTGQFLREEAQELFCTKGKKTFTLGGGNQAATIVREMAAEFNCDEFQRWHEGKTSEEHDAMAMSEIVRAELAAQRAENAAWQLTIEQSVERRHRETLAAQKQLAAKGIAFQFAFALIAAIVALVAAKFVPWFRLPQ